MERRKPSAEFGARVRALRESHGWSTTVLGRKANISQQQISYIENGNAKKPDRIAGVLATALGTTPEWLLEASGPTGGPPPIMSPGEMVDDYASMTEAQQRQVSEFIREIKSSKEKIR